jgi:hypothetical protein
MMFPKLLAGAVSIGAIVGTSATQVGQVQTASARVVVERAATALGGVERIRVVKNITLHGYGQYAYQIGGGRISASPDAPEKYMAANDLTRIYDLEHDRFQMRERRNMLFPFSGRSATASRSTTTGSTATSRSTSTAIDLSASPSSATAL